MPTKKELQNKSEHKLKIIMGHFARREYDDLVENSGYVIELGLKAAICRELQLKHYPDERKYFTHNFDELIALANLQDSLENRKHSSVEFFTNWSIITKWSPNFRYEPIGTNSKAYAKDVLNAITDKEEGVFQWIKMNW